MVVDINARLGCYGVPPGLPAVDLAMAINDVSGLEFAGLMTYEAPTLCDSSEDLVTESRKCIQRVLDTRQMIEAVGLEVEVVSAGGTYNHEIASDMSGVTEVPAGSYALMDQRCREQRSQFVPAARTLTTVTSAPEPGVVITDGGQKTIGADPGLPVVEDPPGVEVRPLAAEHSILHFDPSAGDLLDLGDKVWYVPWDIGNCVNLHDYMFGVRNGVLEVVWGILARGQYH